MYKSRLIAITFALMVFSSIIMALPPSDAGFLDFDVGQTYAAMSGNHSNSADVTGNVTDQTEYKSIIIEPYWAMRLSTSPDAAYVPYKTTDNMLFAKPTNEGKENTRELIESYFEVGWQKITKI